MPSYLMPSDSDKELHVKLLDLLEDATSQYHAMNALNIPDKVKIKSQADYNICLEKFIGLPKRKEIISHTCLDSAEYRNTCKTKYFKFLDFYEALEALIVNQYRECQHLDGNEYLINALAKIPQKNLMVIKTMPDLSLTPRSQHSSHPSPRESPRKSPRSSPREDSVLNKETNRISPRKRGNSHAISPLSWMNISVKNTEQATESQQPRCNSTLNTKI